MRAVILLPRSQHGIMPAAVIAQVPYTGGLPRGPLLMSLGVSWALPYAVLDSIKQLLGLRPIYIPVCGMPGDLSIISPPGCLEGYRKITVNEG